MPQFKNDMKINEIKMKKRIHNFCTIGKDWYTSNLSIVFQPDEIIPDYIEVEKAMDEIDKKELVIEEVVAQVTDILREYEPKYIKVTNSVDDAKHLSVEVTKEYSKQ